MDEVRIDAGNQAVAAANIGSTVRASWPFSLDVIRQNIAGYDASAQEALVAAFRWCIDLRHPMSKAEFARRVGYSDNVCYKLLAGKYLHPDTKAPMDVPEELVRNIQEFLRVEQARFEGGQTEFVLTPTAKRILTACDLARESQTPVIVWGPSHIGKTWTFRHYTSTNNHGRTFMVELDAASGLGGMVRRIADSCGISDKSCTQLLIERIKRALSPNTLLIMDEVHLLRHTYRLQSFFACIEVIRRIHDFTGCGMVLAWTHLDNLRSASEGELQQVWRRGVHKIALPAMPTKGDLASILKHDGLQFPERELEVTIGKVTDKPYDILRQLSKRDGLKAITERIRYGRKLAGRANEKLRWEHFVDAHLRIERESVQIGEWV